MTIADKLMNENECPVEVGGDFEDEAFRAFTEKSHADDFISGKIRFSNINVYKCIEDEKRRDKTEGESHVKVGGISSRGIIVGNGIFVCCFYRTLEAVEDSDIARNGFVVRVKSPRNLAVDISCALPQLGEKFIGGVEGVLVKYTKGDTILTQPDPKDRMKLSYSQKPKDPYEQENEFRMVLISEGDSDECIEVDIGKSVNECCLISM